MNDMIFNYFIGDESEQFSFIRVPKIFFTDDSFSALSFGSKILYGLLLDRLSLSRKNKWYDAMKRVYVIYTIESIQEDFHISKTVAVNLLKELEDFGLIEKKRRPNAPAMIYVKNFIISEEKECKEMREYDGSPENGIPKVQNVEVQKMEFPKSQEISGSLKDGLPENRLPEVQKMESNKTNINKTNINYLISSSSDLNKDDVTRYIKELINYSEMVRNGNDRFFMDKVIGCLADVFLSNKSHENINGCVVPIKQVKLRIIENLNEENFCIILSNMRVNGAKTIYHLQKYVIACFYKLVKIERKEQQGTEKNSFNNFKQNSYDFNKLEKELLSKNEVQIGK